MAARLGAERWRLGIISFKALLIKVTKFVHLRGFPWRVEVGFFFNIFFFSASVKSPQNVPSISKTSIGLVDGVKDRLGFGSFSFGTCRCHLQESPACWGLSPGNPGRFSPCPCLENGNISRPGCDVSSSKDSGANPMDAGAEEEEDGREEASVRIKSPPRFLQRVLARQSRAGPGKRGLQPLEPPCKAGNLGKNSSLHQLIPFIPMEVAALGEKVGSWRALG